ncbi:MAG: nitric oxide reductase [Nitrospira sp.]|nr:nitric oxide reductase [Nitrospira sp.]
MGNLISEALSMGWMALAILAGLLVYFQVSIADPVAKKRAVFKTFIGIVATFLLFMAIANYANNFYGQNRLLPASLALITVTSFVMAMYFTNLGALLKIGGFMFFVAAFLSGYGNWLPQVEGGFPPKEEKITWDSMTPQQLADKGEEIIFGGIGKSSVQGEIGKGQCPLCHGFQKGFLSERAPNLYGLPERAEKERLADPRYSMNAPAKRDTVEKESCPGCGTGTTGQEYIAESHACPNCYVVAGFGLKGSNDRESQMPKIHKPPISLSLPELAAVDTWMYLREGKEPPSYEEIIKSYEKFVPESDRPKQQEDKPAGGAASSLLADGSEPVDQIFAKGQCVSCHVIPGIPGANGHVGPPLILGTTGTQRLTDPAYRGEARTVHEYIVESVLDPQRFVVQGYPEHTMPTWYGSKLSALALEQIAAYLERQTAQH